jgi:phosphatidylserine/phosphatidylglycerophosphate/cardiolipin synthase-like enzyme
MSLLTHYTNPANMASADATEILAANAIIDFAAYSLTEPTVINALLAAAKLGRVVRLYLDRSELEAEARGNPTLPNSPLHLLLGVPGITIKVKRSIILMHLKSYCVDGKMLRDGSANFSALGESEQDNSVTYTDDVYAIAAFQAKFDAMWARPDNLDVTGAIELSASYTSTRPHIR